MPTWEKASSFKEYLEAKKVDTAAWRQADLDGYMEHKKIFDKIGPKNFDQQNKFLVNDWRGRYPGISTQERGPEPPSHHNRA